jgi:hypothetical protein
VLPPEVVMLLPWMSLAELKVVIAAVARLMQVGGAEPITLTEFQQITGLDRKSVLVGIERAMKRGLLVRYEISGYQGHKSFVYELKPNFIGGNFPPMLPVKAKQSKVNVDESESSTTNLTLLNLSEREKILQKTGENGQKSALFERLRSFGVYTKTARFLLQNFPHERIEKCLEIYPLAVRTGRADGPGWLVGAISDPSWDLETEQADLQDRLDSLDRPEAAEQKPKAAPNKPALPKVVLSNLHEIGWNGSVTELAEHYRTDRKRFKAWLDWAKQQPHEYAAARFLTGLRSGLEPPVKKLAVDDRRRYVEGPYAEFIEH